MTRGKHAAQAARARAQAASDAADLLAEKLADEKIRRRRNDVAAVELPALRQRVRDLERQIAEGTSDELRRQIELNNALQDQVDALAAENASLQDRWDSLTDKLIGWAGGGYTGIQVLARTLGFHFYMSDDQIHALSKRDAEGARRVHEARYGPRLATDANPVADMLAAAAAEMAEHQPDEPSEP